MPLTVAAVDSSELNVLLAKAAAEESNSYINARNAILSHDKELPLLLVAFPFALIAGVIAMNAATSAAGYAADKAGQAYDAAGNVSGQSNSASATTFTSIAQDTVAPSVPTNLSATAISSTQIKRNSRYGYYIISISNSNSTNYSTRTR